MPHYDSIQVWGIALRLLLQGHSTTLFEVNEIDSALSFF